MATSAAPRTFTSLPDKYNGEADLDSWLCLFDVCAKANGWEDAEKALFLPTLLTGRAFLAYKDMSEEDKTSFQSLRRGLISVFAPPERKRIHMAEFRSRYQRKGENVYDYVMELRRLLSKAMPHLAEESRDEFVLEQFIHGLDGALQEKVMQANPENLTAAVTTAKQFEALAEIRTHITPTREYSTVPVRSCTNVSVESAEVREMARLIKELGEQVRDLQMAVHNKPQAVEEPPGLLQQRWSPEPKRQVRFATRDNGGRPVCYFCGQRGHTQWRCRWRFREEQNDSFSRSPYNSTARGSALDNPSRPRSPGSTFQNDYRRDLN